MSQIIHIFELNTDVEQQLLNHVASNDLIFEFIDHVFENPCNENIQNLSLLYKTFNNYDINILQSIQNNNGQKLVDYYRERDAGLQDNALLKTHVQQFLSSITFSHNLMNLFKKSEHQPPLPSLTELVQRIELLERKMNALEIRSSNKDVFSDGSSV
jgi:hypothetical protein